MLRRLLYLNGAININPLPNDGICPWCDHHNKPAFGTIRCESCGRVVADSDLVRNMNIEPVHRTPTQTIVFVVICLVYVVIAFYAIEKVMGI